LKRLALPLSLVLLTALAGCHRQPANPLLGSWTSTTPADAYGAAGCPTHYKFTADTQTLIMGGQTISMQVAYEVKPKLVVVVMPRRSNGFKFLTPDSVAWTIGSCTYNRD
jgi:hypothetical protein